MASGGIHGKGSPPSTNAACRHLQEGASRGEAVVGKLDGNLAGILWIEGENKKIAESYTTVHDLVLHELLHPEAPPPDLAAIVGVLPHSRPPALAAARC